MRLVQNRHIIPNYNYFNILRLHEMIMGFWGFGVLGFWV